MERGGDDAREPADVGKKGSLHAKVALEADDLDGRERLARGLSRPAIATERLSLDEHGRVGCRLRRHWKDGIRAVAFAPLDFIARLAALATLVLLIVPWVLVGAGAWRFTALANARMTIAWEPPRYRAVTLLP